MAAVPLGIRQVSGPVSVHQFDVPHENENISRASSNKLYIFGDEHFSYDNMCEPCVPKTGCVKIVDFIKAHAREARATGSSLDVFLEMPYVVAEGSKRAMLLRAWDSLMQSNAGPEAEASVVRRVVNRLLGNSPFYVGVFSQLYKEYAKDLYDDELKRVQGRPGPGSVRFHYCDARTEPNVIGLLPINPLACHARIKTAVQLRELLHAFVFGRDFIAEVRRILGQDVKIDADALSTLGPLAPSGPKRRVHKVAKQYHKLRDGRVKQALRSYLEDRIDEVVDIMVKDVGFEHGEHALAPPAAPSYNDPWLSKLREVHSQFYLPAFELGMRLGVWVILMDAYLLGRMCRFVTQTAETVSGTSVVYVGDAHAEFYVKFFTQYMKLEPVLCKARESGARNGATNRCVDLLKSRRKPCVSSASKSTSRRKTSSTSRRKTSTAAKFSKASAVTHDLSRYGASLSSEE